MPQPELPNARFLSALAVELPESVHKDVMKRARDLIRTCWDRAWDKAWSRALDDTKATCEEAWSAFVDEIGLKFRIGDAGTSIGICPACGKEARFHHRHSTAYGITDTHRAGSEHFVCSKCDESFYASGPHAVSFRFLYD